MREVIIRNEEDTKAFGYELAESLAPGAVLALIGNLGTGKTTLTKYIAEGLGITEMLTSPTFTIVREYYSGRLPLYHFDVYRLESAAELFSDRRRRIFLRKRSLHCGMGRSGGRKFCLTKPCAFLSSTGKKKENESIDVHFSN